MPIDHEIADAEGLAYVTARDPVDLEAVRGSISGLAGEPGFRPDLGILVDLRGMDYIPSNDDIQVIADCLGRMKESYRSRIAVVVADDLRFGLFRMASTYANLRGVTMRIFRDTGAARSWLAET